MKRGEREEEPMVVPSNSTNAELVRAITSAKDNRGVCDVWGGKIENKHV